MPLRNTRELLWKPKGCSDAIDGSNAFPGAMASLINLVPSPSTMDQFVPRPARDYLTNFVASAFSTSPSAIQNIGLFGDTIFGFITTLRNPGYDEPFAVNAITGAIIPVSGVTATNVPTTPPVSGATQKPLFANVGAYNVWTHPGFPGGLFNSTVPGNITANTAAGQSLLTGFFNISGINPGLVLSDTAGAIPANSVVVSVGNIDLNVVANGSLGAASFTVSNAAQIVPGMLVAGPGLQGIVGSVGGPGGLTVTLSQGTLQLNLFNAVVSFHGTFVTMSLPATVTFPADTIAFALGGDRTVKFGWFDLTGANIQLTATLTNGSPNASVTSIVGLSPGQNITGTGIPLGARIQTLQNPSLTLVQGAILGGTTSLQLQVTYSAGTPTPLPLPAVGATVTGPGIPAGTTVSSSVWTDITATASALTVTLSAPASSTNLLTGNYSIGGLYNIVMTANATAGGSQTLTITGGTVAAPLWCAGDTVINGLPSTPVGVGNFFGRAYFACGINGAAFSDIQNPASRTNSNQAVVPGNGLPVTACVGQPLLSPITGGMSQAVYLFQAEKAIFQITGDPTTGNLSLTALNIATGTLAPASICPTTLGLAFMSPEGMRLIDFTGTIGQPLGEGGQGETTPFINASDATRVTAAANGNVLRVAVQNVLLIRAPWGEWWYDLARKIWTGPHQLDTSCIAAYGDTFITASMSIPAQLYKSASQYSGLVDHVEDGDTLGWQYQTVLLPDSEGIAENSIIEATLGILNPSDQPVTIKVYDESSTLLDQISIPGAYTPPKYGALPLWGAGLFNEVPGFFRQETLNWHQPLTFKQASFVITGTAAFGFAIGSLRLRYQKLGYIQPSWPYASIDISVPPLPDAPFINGSAQGLIVSAAATPFTVIGAVLSQEAHNGPAVAASLILQGGSPLLTDIGDVLALVEFTDSGVTGATHGSILIDGLSTNVLTEGWLPGHIIQDSAGSIPPGTYITWIANNGRSVQLSQSALYAAPGVSFAVSGINLVSLWTSPLTGVAQLVGQIAATVPGYLTSFFPFIVTVIPQSGVLVTGPSGQALITGPGGAIITP